MSALLLANESNRSGNFASFDVELWQWGAFVALIWSAVDGHRPR